jgi:hypothetical protein
MATLPITTPVNSYGSGVLGVGIGGRIYASAQESDPGGGAVCYTLADVLMLVPDGEGS